MILSGRRASLDALGRLVFAARRLGGDTVEVFDYRGALPETGASTVRRLGSKPLAAKDGLPPDLPAATEFFREVGAVRWLREAEPLLATTRSA